MANNEHKNRRMCQMVQLTVVTWYRPTDGYLCGHLHVAKGWHYHFAAISPSTYNGNPVDLTTVTQGPFDSEMLALAHAEANGAVFQ